ncbi:MAG: beta-galactosidase trimerization domain-containing protein [Longimicrobiales bacterium]|nr:beta-galactosidase trimerization domain-containing protein [Longimicrobiales bacterium]
MRRLFRSAPAFCLLLLGVATPLPAQVIPPELDTELRLEGNYGRRSLPNVDYDFAAYRLSDRIDTRFGEYRSWDYPYEPRRGRFDRRPEYRLEQPYFTRTGGVKRGAHFSADSIGALYRNHYLLWADGLGNTLYESLKISDKYGLNHYFYAPDYDPYRQPPDGPRLPFTDRQLAAYADSFPAELDLMEEFLGEVQPLYARPFMHNPDQLWMLFTGIDTSPLGLFLLGLERDAEHVNTEFRDRYGYDLPLDPDHDPADPGDVVRRIELWEYMREQHGRVTGVRSRQFRDRIAGPGIIASNIHMATQVDYEWYGENFDHPGVAIRPILQEGELVWKYYMGYGTRLTNDLTDRIPLVSPRINLASSGARIVPTADAIRHWFSQVVQNGAVGFYDWLKDYPAREGDPTAYGGAVFGHPDPSARGPERWQTALEMARTLGQAYVFVPPPSEFGIFVNIEDGNVEDGWHDVFSAYIELTEAGVWSTFISSTELRRRAESPDRYRVLVVPSLKYVDRSVVTQLEAFARDGGTLVVSDPEAFAFDLDAKPLDRARRSILGVRGVERRQHGPTTITLQGVYDGLSVRPYDDTYAVAGLGDATAVVGRHADGAPAITAHELGEGRVIFAPGTLFDIYRWADYSADAVDTARYAFYKRLETEHGIEDRSWVWDVTVDNVHEITGVHRYDLPPIDETIRFRWYMNPFLP